jgi:hypothetical protein
MSGTKRTDNARALDAFTPVKNESGQDVWMKIGKAWTPGPGKADVIISLMTLPLGHTGPLRVFLYPEKTFFESKQKHGQQGDVFDLKTANDNMPF